MHNTRIATRGSVLIATVAILSLSACENRHEPVEQVPPTPETPLKQPPSSRPLPSPLAAADSFASEVRQLLKDSGAQTAVLPPVDERTNRISPCSTALADLLVDALVRAGLGVVDRETLARSWEEIDLAAAFDNTAPAADIAPADLLVVGRYNLVAGNLELRVKAVEVRTNRLVLTRALVMHPDARLKSLATQTTQSATPGRDVSVDQKGSIVQITASHAEPGADTLRLLDRVRQKQRRALGDYLREAMGCKMSADELEQLFLNGRESDCRFGDGEVTLVMEFGVEACMGDDGAG